MNANILFPLRHVLALVAQTQATWPANHNPANRRSLPGGSWVKTLETYRDEATRNSKNPYFNIRTGLVSPASVLA